MTQFLLVRSKQGLGRDRVCKVYSHTHPPYHVGNHGHDLVIMRSPKMLTPNEYDVFFSFLENTVMKNAY